MKNIYFEIFSTIIILILGIILHFTYEWSGYNLLIGTFSAINESIWEHLQLIFFPMILTMTIGYVYSKDKSSNYLCNKLLGILLSLSFIIISFYTYTGILGYNFVFVDISIFFLAAIIGQYYSYKRNLYDISCKNKYICLIILVVLTFCFIIFTFIPPRINLFLDPITKTFGIS